MVGASRTAVILIGYQKGSVSPCKINIFLLNNGFEFLMNYFWKITFQKTESFTPSFNPHRNRF